MARGILTPLQITAASALFNNTGVKPLPTSLTSALNTINATTLFTNFLAAVNYYVAQSFATASTLEKLLTIGNTVCPALGNSIPAYPVGQFQNLNYVVSATDGSSLSPYGFTGLIYQTGNAYLGNGDIGRFAMGFMAVQGWINTTNQFINSAVNAQSYLGPTFTSMDALTTNSLTDINTNLEAFATDLANQGNLYSTKYMDSYGTPAGLLFQLSIQGNMINGTLPAVRDALHLYGLTNKQIKDLCSNNVQSLFNPTGLTPIEFDKLQKPAYEAMKTITGPDLEPVLGILEVSLPNINTMADLLDPKLIFPTSYSTMQMPTANGPMPIYDGQGGVINTVAPNVSTMLPSPSGCDQLGKIIPPAQAVANKAIQVSLQQISNLAATDFPRLANTIKCTVRDPWIVSNEYLANSLVVVAPFVNYSTKPLATLSSTSQVYRAQQDVPAGTNITDTAYWEPVTLCGINTMSGLPLIQAQTTPIDASVASYFATEVATGTGPNGTITTCDVLGTAIDYNDIAGYLATATTAINALQTAGSLATLNTAYTTIAAAANDAAVLTQITNANNAIAALSASPYVTTLNTAWVAIATGLSDEKTYQTKAGIDYFNLQSGDTATVMGFVLNLPQYAENCTECGPYQFLTDISDTTTLGGQAIVASMREAVNQTQLGAAGISQNIKPSTEPEITPPCAVNPVY